MGWMIICFLMGGLVPIIWWFEMRANEKRIDRGEDPVRHHDATDYIMTFNRCNWKDKR